MASKITESLIFSVSLTTARTFHRLSQEELAKKLNVSRQTVGRWEQGKCSPDYQTFRKIQKILPTYIEIEAIAYKLNPELADS